MNLDGKISILFSKDGVKLYFFYDTIFHDDYSAEDRYCIFTSKSGLQFDVLYRNIMFYPNEQIVVSDSFGSYSF